MSPVGAAGIAQFIRSSAESLGLRVLDSVHHDDWQQRVVEVRSLIETYERLNPAVRQGAISTDSLHLIYRKATDNASELGKLLARGRETTRPEALDSRLDETRRDFAAICQSRNLKPRYAPAFDAFLSSYVEKRRQRELSWIAYENDLETVFRNGDADRDVFDRTEIAAISAKDQRFTYSAIAACVELMAQNLSHPRISGNILSALAAYNAGPSRTRETGVFEKYGKVPAIGETATYVSRVLNLRHLILGHLR